MSDVYGFLAEFGHSSIFVMPEHLLSRNPFLGVLQLDGEYSDLIAADNREDDYLTDEVEEMTDYNIVGKPCNGHLL